MVVVELVGPALSYPRHNRGLICVAPFGAKGITLKRIHIWVADPTHGDPMAAPWGIWFASVLFVVLYFPWLRRGFLWFWMFFSFTARTSPFVWVAVYPARPPYTFV